MSSVGTASPDTVPRDYNYLLGLRPSVRFRLMNQIGAFPNQSDKIAYSSAPPDQQAQALLAALQQVDSGGGAPPPQQMQMPQAQQPVQPQMQMPPQPAAQQVQMPFQQPAFQQPTSQVAPVAPVAPMAVSQPRTMQMPGAPGMAAPTAAAAPPAAAQPPRQQVQMPTQQRAPKAQDGRDPNFVQDDDPLATIIANQQHIKQSLQSISSSMQLLVNAIDQLKNQAASSNQTSGIMLLTLATFMEAAMQRPRDQIAQELHAAIAGGELQSFLQQALGGQ